MKRFASLVGACCSRVHLGVGATRGRLPHRADRAACRHERRQRPTRAPTGSTPRATSTRSYAARIYKGRLPPLIHAVVVVETTVDESGQPRDVKVIRGPSHAPDVSAAVVEMIRRAGPLPRTAPHHRAGEASSRSGWSTRTAASSSTR